MFLALCPLRGSVLCIFFVFIITDKTKIICKKTNIVFSYFVEETHTFKCVPFPLLFSLVFTSLNTGCRSTKAVRAHVESRTGSPVTKVGWHTKVSEPSATSVKFRKTDRYGVLSPSFLMRWLSDVSLPPLEFTFGVQVCFSLQRHLRLF